MSSEYNLPEDIDALFQNVPESYHIFDRDHPGDNIFAMNLFLDCIGVPVEMVEEDYGTQVTLNNGHKRIVIDSGGRGDFHLHGYEVSIADEQPVKNPAQPSEEDMG